MSPRLALLLCFGFIAFLFYRDRARGDRISSAVWIPLLWVFIIATKPITLWFGGNAIATSGDAASEGSPADRLLFLGLIVAGLIVLVRRRLDWHRIVRRNWWFGVFCLYLGLSTLWSDYTAVAFKRWIKDMGNVVMVLVVLSGPNPVADLKALLVRCCYLVVPLSVVLIKYFPNIGRYYSPWGGNGQHCGVTTDKNMLGMTLFACALTLIWVFLDLRLKHRFKRAKLDHALYLLLGGMTIWLLREAHSSTAIACTALGLITFLVAGYPVINKRLGWFVPGCAIIAILVLLLNAVFDLAPLLVRILGRDMTLTGRLPIWQMVLEQDTNALVGEGFYSFWLGDRNAELSAKYFYELGTAHNSYIETYLNSGWVGLGLLFIVMLFAMNRIQKQVVGGDMFARFRLACFVAVIPYGFTESCFNRLSPIWFLLLITIIDGVSMRVRGKNKQATVESNTSEGAFVRQF